MYVRSKVVKGRRYYQVVEGVRVGGRVKQIIHAPLGTTPDPKVALGNMKRMLAELEERVESGMAAERIDREQGRMESRARKLRIQIDHLAGIIEAKLIGMAPRRCTASTKLRAYHEAGHAVARFEAGLVVKLVTIDPIEDTGGHVLLPKRTTVDRFMQYYGSAAQRKRLFRDLAEICAGSAAEAIVAPEIYGDRLYINGSTDSGDLHDALELLEDLELHPDVTREFLGKGFGQAKEMLRKPEVWAQVKALAEALMEQRRLNGYKAKWTCEKARSAHISALQNEYYRQHGHYDPALTAKQFPTIRRTRR